MKNICKSFFGKRANNRVCFDLMPGEIHALLGENGAGKTTLMNILYGIYSRDSGVILWKGQEVSFTSPREAIACHIGMVHQHFMLVPTLTVSQNITLGLREKGYPFPDRKALNATITEVSEKYGLEIDVNAYISSLSVGEQQRVEIIKLLYRDAELLILDEPTAMLTPQETEYFFEVLRKLRADGRSVIIITHRIPEIMSITDRVTVLRDGCNVVTEKTSDITEQELSQYMIGRQLNSIQREPIVPDAGREGLLLEDVSLKEKNIKGLDSISLQIAPGEIVGVAGVDGNGQKELVEVILGIRKQSSGKIGLDGLDMSSMSVLERKKLGIGYISDDRQQDGLVMDMNLTDNMLLKTHTEQQFIKGGLINARLVWEDTKKVVEEYAIKTPDLNTPLRNLSGGNQQKLILAREMAGDPKAIVAHQPTRGLDIGATEFVQQQLLQRRSKGCCILLISADLEEILLLSDRIAVIYKGRFMGIFPNTKDLNLSHIGLMMAGRTSEVREESL
ncbi:ABC transporter ATP-binding protein [Desulfosporosinus sp.]|uniref:ABC transporter ATP-binding protein n=1 Tax=Desulfosporosinus sp. TaxID=157907 RepID=UPI00345BC6F9